MFPRCSEKLLLLSMLRFLFFFVLTTIQRELYICTRVYEIAVSALEYT